MEVPIDRFLLPKDLQEMLQERVKTFNNMAQAQMKLTAWDSAMASVRQVRPGQTTQTPHSPLYLITDAKDRAKQ